VAQAGVEEVGLHARVARLFGRFHRLVHHGVGLVVLACSSPSSTASALCMSACTGGARGALHQLAADGAQRQAGAASGR
jgi:hypothetical protein